MCRQGLVQRCESFDSKAQSNRENGDYLSYQRNCIFKTVPMEHYVFGMNSVCVCMCVKQTSLSLLDIKLLPLHSLCIFYEWGAN